MVGSVGKANMMDPALVAALGLRGYGQVAAIGTNALGAVRLQAQKDDRLSKSR
ncbi:MAG: hypothetical protein HC918_12420 [Oscillatoriales cyanobacterium SM2_1_8]|nr:hypothetical protein [Oscillatoriales cyanobacterium SM2_1_8]